MQSPVKKAGKTAAHPKISVMVETTIMTLAKRKGSSLHAIKKYIGVNYNVDVQKLSLYIKKYLKSAVESGDVIQTSGKGASGSFKINNKKVTAKQKAHKVKLEKPLQIQTSTPKMTPKPKKILAKNSDKIPVKKINLTDDQGTSVISTFIKPKISKKPRLSVPTKSRKHKDSLPLKIKKPKKLIAYEVHEPKAVVSSEVKSDNIPTRTRPQKTLMPKKSLEAPDKRPVKKMNLTDDQDTPGYSYSNIPEKSKVPRVTVPTKGRKPKDSQLINMKKLIAKKVHEPKTAVSSEEKSDNIPTQTHPQKTLMPKKSLVKSPDKRPLKKMNLTDDQDAPGNSSFNISEKSKMPRLSIPTKGREQKDSQLMKIKKPKKMIVKKMI